MKKIILFSLLAFLPLQGFSRTFDQIIIKVNNKAVTLLEMERFKIFARATGSLPAAGDVDAQVRQQLASILVLEYFAEEKSLEITDKDISREINDILDRMQIPGEAQLLAGLSQQAKAEITPEDLRFFLRKQLLIKKAQEYVIFQEKRSEMKMPTEEEVRAFYQRHRDQYFKAPAEIEIAHLVILLDKNAGFRETQGAEKKLEEIQKKALAIKDLDQRESFFYEQVEKEASLIYRKNQGRLGSFDAQKLNELFPQYGKALELPRGGISPVIATEFGRQIVLVTAKKGGEVLELKQVQSRIEQILMMQQGGNIFETWLKNYASQFTVTQF